MFLVKLSDYFEPISAILALKLSSCKGEHGVQDWRYTLYHALQHNPLLRNHQQDLLVTRIILAKKEKLFFLVDLESFIPTSALAGIQNFQHRYGNGDILTFMPSRGLRRLYFPPSGKSTWLTVLVAPTSRLLGAITHVPRLLWSQFCAALSGLPWNRRALLWPHGGVSPS